MEKQWNSLLESLGHDWSPSVKCSLSVMASNMSDVICKFLVSVWYYEAVSLSMTTDRRNCGIGPDCAIGGAEFKSISPSPRGAVTVL